MYLSMRGGVSGLKLYIRGDGRLSACMIFFPRRLHSLGTSLWAIIVQFEIAREET